MPENNTMTRYSDVSCSISMPLTASTCNYIAPVAPFLMTQSTTLWYGMTSVTLFPSHVGLPALLCACRPHWAAGGGL
jgi:hypothetical protein